MFTKKFAQAGVVSFLLVIFLATSVIGAEPKKSNGQFGVGDLVEFTTGLGPMFGEVLNGPDQSNYYGILVPSKGEKPINGAKLRLIQRAGAPNAAIATGAAVSWSDGGYIEKGNVVKVNGNWCQVKTPSETTIGWVECKSLRVAGQANAPAAPAETAPSAPPAATAAAAAAISGTYQNAEGNATIEFLPAGKAHFSIHGAGGPVTYKVAGNKLTLMLDDVPMEFTINPDNSLTGPDGYLSRLKKKKE